MVAVQDHEIPIARLFELKESLKPSCTNERFRWSLAVHICFTYETMQ